MSIKHTIYINKLAKPKEEKKKHDIKKQINDDNN